MAALLTILVIGIVVVVLPEGWSDHRGVSNGTTTTTTAITSRGGGTMAARSSGRSSLKDSELKNLLDNIKGDDNRLFRWDATTYTYEKRRDRGCRKLDEAIAVLMDSTRKSTSQSLAAEFLTFCITDSPPHRGRFSNFDGIHEVVVDLVVSKDHYLSSLASHLIYIASFANRLNHQTFIEANAVPALAKIIMSKTACK